MILRLEDYLGVERGVYYSRMSNGWTVILTIPFQEILMGDRNVAIYVVTAIGIFLFILMAAMVLRDLLQSRRIRRASNTIHILTDSFYAIYRVNFRSGTYEAIKTSQDLVGALPESGNFSQLLETVQSLGGVLHLSGIRPELFPGEHPPAGKREHRRFRRGLPAPPSGIHISG